MLTIKRCRKLLGKNCKLSDRKIEVLRDQLYQNAEIVIDIAGPNLPEQSQPPDTPPLTVKALSKRKAKKRRKSRTVKLEEILVRNKGALYCGKIS